MQAADKGLVAINECGRKRGGLAVVYRTTAAGATSEDQVDKLETDDCIAVCAYILVRNSGTKRRRVAMLSKNGGTGPSTKILTAEAIATRCPTLYWALYDNSRLDSAALLR